jgi:hypothetical protein
MTHISELINTDGYIDCGDNEKLREVVAIIDKEIDISHRQSNKGIGDKDTFVFIYRCYTTTDNTNMLGAITPTHHINDIIF